MSAQLVAVRDGISMSLQPLFCVLLSSTTLLFCDKPNLIVKKKATENGGLKKGEEKQTKCINFLSDVQK